MNTLCTPAHIYLILAIISLIIGAFYKLNLGAFIMKGLWIILWTYLLNYLCRKGHSTISWILVLIPFLLIIGGIFGFMAFMEASKKKKVVVIQHK